MAYILLSLLSLATVGMNEISGIRFEDEKFVVVVILGDYE